VRSKRPAEPAKRWASNAISSQERWEERSDDLKLHSAVTNSIFLVASLCSSQAERKCRRAEEDAKKAREELEVQRKEAEVSNVALAKLDSNSKAALAKVESDSKGGMEKLQSEIKELTGKNDTHEGQAKSLQEAISKLTTSLKTADASITKLKGDRSNIEVYTKQTLHKFQEKYLVALQGCRQKLKDERARNEQLEERLQRDKASQKREERLLSASVYELGLRILSERAQKR